MSTLALVSNVRYNTHICIFCRQDLCQWLLEVAQVQSTHRTAAQLERVHGLELRYVTHDVALMFMLVQRELLELEEDHDWGTGLTMFTAGEVLDRTSWTLCQLSDVVPVTTKVTE